MDYVSFHKSIAGKVLRKIYRVFSERKLIESSAAAELGYKINLDNPQTFNEKLAWIKLYDHNPLYHKMVDKYEVKKIVEEKIGEGYTAKCLAIYDKLEDADFEKIAPPTVIKSTHYGVPIIVKSEKDKDVEKIKKILSEQAKVSGYTCHQEWGYKDVKPRIMFEEYMEDDSDNNVLQDYKFWCFNGEPKVMYVTVKNEAVYENFYDMDFNVLNIDHGFPRRKPEFEKPALFDEMKTLAARLSSGIPFVRVDFYNIKGKVKFGEYTFFDWGGGRPFASYEQDLMIGKWLTLPEKKRK